MQLKLLPDKNIDIPTKRDIKESLGKIYGGDGNALILVADEKKNHFIQVAKLGGHVEYMQDGVLYSADDVSLEECIKVFLDYFNRGRLWRTMLPWREPSKPQEESLKKPKLIEVRKHNEPQWETRKLILAILSGLSAAVLFCVLSTSFPLEKMIFPGFLLILGAIPWLILHAKAKERFVLFSPTYALIILLAAIGLGLLFLCITISQIGLLSLSTISVVVVSAWAIYMSVKLRQQARHFVECAIEVQSDRNWISLMEPLDPDSPHFPVLNYVYLNQYHDYKPVRWQSRRIGRAIREKKLVVIIQYLPELPTVHRISKILTE